MTTPELLSSDQRGFSKLVPTPPTSKVVLGEVKSPKVTLRELRKRGFIVEGIRGGEWKFRDIEGQVALNPLKECFHSL